MGSNLRYILFLSFSLYLKHCCIIIMRKITLKWTFKLKMSLLFSSSFWPLALIQRSRCIQQRYKLFYLCYKNVAVHCLRNQQYLLWMKPYCGKNKSVDFGYIWTELFDNPKLLPQLSYRAPNSSSNWCYKTFFVGILENLDFPRSWNSKNMPF